MGKLTRFELTRLISARALQLSFGAPPLVKLEADDTAYDIAKRELAEKAMPMAIMRRNPSGSVERVELE